jgi:hypothetical protein
VGFGGGILVANWPISEREQFIDEVADYHACRLNLCGSHLPLRPRQ